MKYQKAKSIIHQHGVARDELRRRQEQLKAVEDRIASFEPAKKEKEQERELATAEVSVKSMNDYLQDLTRQIHEAEAKRARFIERVRELRLSLAREPEELQEAKREATRVRESVDRAEKRVASYVPDLPKAQEVIDEVKTREALHRAAQDAAMKQAKEGALAELKKAQEDGKIPAELDVNQLVERYFDRQPKKLQGLAMAQRNLAR